MARVLILFFLLVSPWIVFATPVASLVSLEGDVSVVRAGVLIPSEKVSDGFPVEAFDTVSTGNSGRAEIQFKAETGLVGSVRLDSATSLYVELSPWKSEQTAGLELLAGSVSVFLSSVLGSSSVEVRTEAGRSAVLDLVFA